MLELPINLLKWTRKLKVESSYLPQASHSEGDFLVLRIANAGTALCFFLPVHLTQQFSLFRRVSCFNAFSIIYYRFWKVIICVKTPGRLSLRDTVLSAWLLKVRAIAPRNCQRICHFENELACAMKWSYLILSFFAARITPCSEERCSVSQLCYGGGAEWMG